VSLLRPGDRTGSERRPAGWASPRPASRPGEAVAVGAGTAGPSGARRPAPRPRLQGARARAGRGRAGPGAGGGHLPRRHGSSAPRGALRAPGPLGRALHRRRRRHVGTARERIRPPRRTRRSTSSPTASRWARCRRPPGVPPRAQALGLPAGVPVVASSAGSPGEGPRGPHPRRPRHVAPLLGRRGRPAAGGARGGGGPEHGALPRLRPGRRHGARRPRTCSRCRRAPRDCRWPALEAMGRRAPGGGERGGLVARSSCPTEQGMLVPPGDVPALRLALEPAVRPRSARARGRRGAATGRVALLGGHDGEALPRAALSAGAGQRARPGRLARCSTPGRARPRPGADAPPVVLLRHLPGCVGEPSPRPGSRRSRRAASTNSSGVSAWRRCVPSRKGRPSDASRVATMGTAGRPRPPAP
jgi:hypothetical protein